MEKVRSLHRRCGADAGPEHRYGQSHPGPVSEDNSAQAGLGKSVFNDHALQRRTAAEKEAGFVLNQAAYRKSEVLVVGGNFGCGSSP